MRQMTGSRAVGNMTITSYDQFKDTVLWKEAYEAPIMCPLMQHNPVFLENMHLKAIKECAV